MRKRAYTEETNPYKKLASEGTIEYKRCIRCNKEKPLVQGFSFNPNRPDGHRQLCRACNRELAGHAGYREEQGNNLTPEYRKMVIRDAHNSCQCCGFTRKLQVHHKKPVCLGGHPTDRKNLLVVCKRCHDKIHSRPGMTIEDLANKQLRKHNGKKMPIMKYNPKTGEAVVFKIGDPEPFM